MSISGGGSNDVRGYPMVVEARTMSSDKGGSEGCWAIVVVVVDGSIPGNRWGGRGSEERGEGERVKSKGEKGEISLARF